MAARARLLPLLLALLAALQVAFWQQARPIRPELQIVPPAPSRMEVAAMALGDPQFYFRALTLQMQNFGDLFGRFTALRLYDFNRLYQWFTLLDALDARSNLVPTLAAYYFSQTQHTPDVRYMVDYLYAHALRDVPHKWWWLLQALYLSMHKLNDMDLALKVAAPMINPEVPAWAQQMVAVVHEKRGEMEDALTIMETIKEHAHTLDDKDLRYMEYFVRERLHRLDQLEKFKRSE